jgi:hypothetical protein
MTLARFALPAVLLLAAGALIAASAPPPKTGAPTPPATTSAPRTETVDLEGRGRIALVVPEGWTVVREDPDNPRLLTFQAAAGVNAIGHLGFRLPGDGELETAADVRAQALELGEEQVEGSVEKRAVLQTYKLRSGYGYYSSYTDANLVGKKPIPGDYKTVTVGLFRPAPGIIGIVSIYCDDLAGPEYRQLHAMIENLEVLGPGGARRRGEF